MQWAVPGRYVVIEAAAASVFVVAAALSRDRIVLVVAAGAALLLAGLAARDRIVRVRLCADTDGVTLVHGLTQRRQIPWGEVKAVRVQLRSRPGRSGGLLEIDTGETVYLLSGRELGADPADVLVALDEIRP